MFGIIGFSLGSVLILFPGYSFNLESIIGLILLCFLGIYLYALVGDGDLMEGISYEACSIAGNLNLNNLFKNYDERIVSRFIGYYNICRFFGEDIRFKKM